MKLPALLAAVFLLGACSKNIQTNEAVHDSVVEYLNGVAAEKGLDISAMTVEVAKVSFEKDEARATIAIRPKGVPNGPAAMQIPYILDRKGDKWVVRGTALGATNPHGDVAPSGAAPAGELPAGHPAIGSNGAPTTGALPAGHPPIENKSGTKQ